MKKILAILALSFAVNAFAEQRDADFCRHDDVVIDDDDMMEEKTEADFNIDFPFMPTLSHSRSGAHSYAGVSFDMNFAMMLGFVGIVGGENDAKFQMGRSIEFYMPNILKFKIRTGRSTPSVSIGAGFGLQHLFGKNGACFSLDDSGADNRLATVGFPEGSDKNSSKINRFAITMPLMIEQKIGSSGKVALGVLLDFNTHLGATSRYRVENATSSLYFGDLAMRAMTYEIMGAVSSNSFGAYVKYSPVEVFKKGCGPETKNISVGIVIGL